MISILITFGKAQNICQQLRIATIVAKIMHYFYIIIRVNVFFTIFATLTLIYG